MEKRLLADPPPYWGLGWPDPEFSYKKIVGTTQKLSKNLRLRSDSSLFFLHFLSYASLFCR